jgi:hypothetical protein
MGNQYLLIVPKKEMFQKKVKNNLERMLNLVHNKLCRTGGSLFLGIG